MGGMPISHPGSSNVSARKEGKMAKRKKTKESISIDSDVSAAGHAIAKAQRCSFSALANVTLAERWIGDQSRTIKDSEEEDGNE